MWNVNRWSSQCQGWGPRTSWEWTPAQRLHPFADLEINEFDIARCQLLVRVAFYSRHSKCAWYLLLNNSTSYSSFFSNVFLDNSWILLLGLIAKEVFFRYSQTCCTREMRIAHSVWIGVGFQVDVQNKLPGRLVILFRAWLRIKNFRT